MPFEYQYSVEVTGTTVAGTIDTPDNPGGRYGPVQLPGATHDLHRKTIEVLRLWLNRWTALTRVNKQGEYEHFLRGIVPNTFEVLGRHLYETVFFSNIERGFLAGRDAAREKSATLRVLLMFGRDAEDLAQLPWELLYAKEDYFMAAEHRLVLSRSLVLEQAMIPSLSRKPPLTVHFLVTLPDTDDYRDQRARLLQALTQPAEYNTSIESDVLDHWDQEKAAERLRTPPYPQVVHVIGVCRQVWSSGGEAGTEIYLHDGTRPRWRSGQVLVNLFSQNRGLDKEDRVRLVVLHLCEPSPLDFEVSFERLAPALIHQGIPAVIAMQYPLGGGAAARFIKKLYEGLASGQSIEEAVQGARSDLYTTFEEDRLFGSPVLYMQSIDSQLLPRLTGSAAGADVGPSAVLTPPVPPRSTLDFLLRKLAGLSEPPELRDEAEHILRDGDWPPRLSDVEKHVTRLYRDYVYDKDLARVFAALVMAVKEEMNRSDLF